MGSEVKPIEELSWSERRKLKKVTKSLRKAVDKLELEVGRTRGASDKISEEYLGKIEEAKQRAIKGILDMKEMFEIDNDGEEVFEEHLQSMKFENLVALLQDMVVMMEKEFGGKKKK